VNFAQIGAQYRFIPLQVGELGAAGSGGAMSLCCADLFAKVSPPGTRRLSGVNFRSRILDKYN